MRFCLKENVDPLSTDELIYVDFAIKRHREDGAQYRTIRANIFHIRHYILRETKITFCYSDLKYLKDIIHGIKNKNPIPLGCIPFTDDIVIKIHRELEILGSIKHSWFYYILKTACTFAWGFMLRCSEYSKIPRFKAPLLSDIQFKIGKRKTPVLQYRLERRKTNTHGPTEYIAIPCTCPDFKLCTYHSMKRYLERRNKYNIKSKYLFPYVYGRQWKALSATTFRRVLKIVLKKIYKEECNPKIHRHIHLDMVV